MPAPIPCQRHLFDLPDDVAYLNCAYMSPLLKRAAEVGAEAIARKCRPWRIRADDFFTDSERARALFAELLGARADDIALVPAASYGLAVAAANLPVRRASGSWCWPSSSLQRLHVAGARGAERRRGGDRSSAPPDGDWTRAVLARLDERCDRRPAAMPLDRRRPARPRRDRRALSRGRQRARGGRDPVARRAAARPRRGAPGLPGLPRLQMAARARTASAISTSPGSIGTAARSSRTGSRASGSEDFARLIDYQDAYQPGARRFDVGERSNFALMPVGIVGLEQLLAWGTERIAATLAAKTAAIAERAAAAGAARGAGAAARPPLSGPAFSEGAPDAAARAPGPEQVHVSVRGDSLRVTPHLYNDDGDIERLFAVLRRCCEPRSSGRPGGREIRKRPGPRRCH